MAETVYLTQKIKEILTNMCVGTREKMALFLGDRVSENEIYITNTTGAFEGETTTVSLDRIFHMDKVIGVIINANRYFRERGLSDKYVLFTSHSHPAIVGEIVYPGIEAWSVDDVPPEDNELRGRGVSRNDLDGSLLHFSLKTVSDGKGGDDIFLQMTADRWRAIEYHLFIRPSPYLVNKPMTQDGVAVDCYRYDTQMRLGKIRRIEISPRLLTPQDLMRTLLDSTKVIIETEKSTGNLILPYRRR